MGGTTRSVPFGPSTEDFAPYFERLEGVDAIYINGFVPNLEVIFEWLSRHPVAKPLFSNNAATVPRIRALPMSEGVYVGAPLIYNRSFRFSSEARSKYENRYHKPFSHYAASGYDFMKLMAGLLEGHESSRRSVKERLAEGFVYPGVLGEISVRPGGRSATFPLVAARIAGGEVAYLRLDIPSLREASGDPLEGSR